MRIILILLLMVSVTFASETLNIKKGWQLIGVPISLDVSSSFNNKNVEIIWGFDALTQSWQGYSPKIQTNEKIVQSYSLLNSLHPYSALWIFSSNDWQLEYTVDKPSLIPQNNVIELEIGWNLVSIPQKIVLSDKIFSDALVWKYDENYEWSVNDAKLNFPSIEALKENEGLWVKSDKVVSINIDTEGSRLSTFDSRETMLQYIRNMLSINKYSYGYDDVIMLESQPDPSSSTDKANDATGTNTQEIGVDESDILKHDNTYIYSVDNRINQIIISSFENISKKDYTPIQNIDFKGKNIISIYLQNSRLSVVSTFSNNYISTNILDEEKDSLVISNQNKFSLDIFDTSDVNSIVKIATHVIDGSYRDSRLINGELYMISQFRPNEEEELIPSIASNADSSREILTPNTFYAPLKLNQNVNITTLSSFSISSGNYNKSSSFLGNTHTYYASESSLYLVSSEYSLYYDFFNYKEQQMIYKFSFDENLSYAGRGFVSGRMLNQFSMSEKDDYLRVATTSGWSWVNNGEVSNEVYTLVTKDKELIVEGKLTGLGHEGERIYAVRFIGDRGYVVTFRQTDPLYTLDLSDPKNPKLVGELKIPGFSSYLHVVDENRVLSIGRNADTDGRAQELQFQLFDVSDFSNPVLADKINIGNLDSYSEAQYNHKAFSYRPSDFMFGVPYSNYNYFDSTANESFGVYQLDGLNIIPISTLSSNELDWGNVGRGLIFDINNTTYGALFKGSNILCEQIK